MKVDEVIGLLGLEARDKITGVTGTITTVCFDLYGCVQAGVSPMIEKPGDKRQDSEWFDVKRLDVSTKRVMPVPNFAGTKLGEENGPGDRPHWKA